MSAFDPSGALPIVPTGGGGGTVDFAAVNDVLRTRHPLTSGDLTLSQPSTGSTSWQTGPNRLRLTIPLLNTGTGGYGESLAMSPSTDWSSAVIMRVRGVSTNGGTSEGVYMLAGTNDANALVAVVYPDGSILFGFVLSDAFSPLTILGANGTIAAALAAGTLSFGVRRTPQTVAMIYGIGATLAAAMVSPRVLGSSTIEDANVAGGGAWARVGVDVYSARASDTTVDILELVGACNGGGTL